MVDTILTTATKQVGSEGYFITAVMSLSGI